MRKPFLTPPEFPEGTVCRTLEIPNSKYWLGIFNSALLEMTYAYNYEQVNATDLTIEEVTAYMFGQVAAWFDSECTNACPRIYRMAASGRLEYSENGGDTWVDSPDGGGAIPPTPTVPESSDPLCLAAANFVNVLELTYVEMSEAYSIDPDIDTAVGVLDGIMGTAIGTLLAGTAALIAGAAWALFTFTWAIYSTLTASYWTESVTNKLICLVLEHLEIIDDVPVWIDFEALVMDILALTWEDPLDGDSNLLWAQVAYMLSYLGEAVSAHAAATTAIEEFDCVICDERELVPQTTAVAGITAPSTIITHLGGTRWRMEAYNSGGDWRMGCQDISGRAFTIDNPSFVQGSTVYKWGRRCSGAIENGAAGFPNGLCYFELGVSQSLAQVKPIVEFDAIPS